MHAVSAICETGWNGQVTKGYQISLLAAGSDKYKVPDLSLSVTDSKPKVPDRRSGGIRIILTPVTNQRLCLVLSTNLALYKFVFVFVFVYFIRILPLVITFRVSRRRCEIYSAHGCLCVCLSLAAFPHYCTDPGVT